MRRIIGACAFALLLGLTASLAGCSGLTVNSDYDPDTNFTDYQSWAWIVPSDSSKQRLRDPLVERRVVRAIEDQLEAKGYQKATTGTPDFLVNFYASSQQKVDVSTYYTGWGYYGWYGGTSVDVRQWEEGTLVIDVIDFDTQALSWRGWAKGAVERSLSTDQITQRVNDVIGKVMDRFPPQP
jgi:hypothetical protein